MPKTTKKESVKEQLESEEYLGWKNFESWSIFTTLSNEEGTARMLAEIAQSTVKNDEFRRIVVEEVIWKRGVDKAEDGPVRQMLGTMVLRFQAKADWNKLRAAFEELSFS